MSNDGHGLVFLNLMYQLDKVRVDEGLHSNPHRLFTLHIHESRIVSVILQLCVLPGCVPLLWPLREFLPFIEAEVLLSEELELCGFGRDWTLSFTNSFCCDDCSLEVGRKEMSDPHAGVKEVTAKAIGLQNAMVCEGRVCGAGTGIVSG